MVVPSPACPVDGAFGVGSCDVCLSRDIRLSVWSNPGGLAAEREEC